MSDRVQECLRNASECLAKAALASNEQVKTELENLAKHWQLLAAEHEKFLKSILPLEH